jgi:glucokinase
VACFGVAGAVIDGRSNATNLPWQLDERALGSFLGCRHVKLLNDLEAAAYGMLHLPPEKLHVLQEGDRPRANCAVIAAGTGLGEAMLWYDGTRWHPVASEGGHASFAPQDDEEVELLRYLRARLQGHVSTERVLSGPGLRHVYEFLRDTGRFEEPKWLAEELAQGDPSADISTLALAGKSALCEAALRRFVRIYGAEAGDLAIRVLARGGVYLGGGIAPKILPALEAPDFREAFRAKGRFQPLLERIPIAVALDPSVPLLGAAHFASGLVGRPGG